MSELQLRTFPAPLLHCWIFEVSVTVTLLASLVETSKDSTRSGRPRVFFLRPIRLEFSLTDSWAVLISTVDQIRDDDIHLTFSSKASGWRIENEDVVPPACNANLRRLPPDRTALAFISWRELRGIESPDSSAWVPHPTFKWRDPMRANF